MSQIAQRLLGMNQNEIFNTDFRTEYQDTRTIDNLRNIQRYKLRNHVPKALRTSIISRIFSILN